MAWISEEVTVTVEDDEGVELEVAVRLVGLLAGPTMYDPGETPEVEIPGHVPQELHARIAEAAMEAFLESYYEDKRDAR